MLYFKIVRLLDCYNDMLKTKNNKLKTEWKVKF
jgi:hypothetical protein